MAGRSISIRFTVADADEAKRKLEELGRSGAFSLDRISAASTKAQASIAQATAATNQARGQSIANTFAGVRTADAGQAERRQADAMAAFGQEVDRLRARFVPLVAEQQRYKASLQEIAAAERQGALSAAEASAARQRTKDAFAAQVQATRGHTEAQAAATAATRTAKEAADAHAKSVAQQGQQFSQLIPQINDVFASLGSGASVMTVLLQQGGQVTQIYGGVAETFRAIPRTIGSMTASMAGFAGPLGIGAVVVGLGLMAASAERAERRLETLTQRARATRDDFAAAGREIEAAAKAAAATGTIGKTEARDAAQAIRTAPGFSGTQAELTDLIRVSQDLSRVMGEGVAESARRVAKGFDDAHAAAQELAGQGFRTLDAQTTRAIERLQNQGKAAEATALLLDRVRQATAGADAARTPFEQGMRDLAKAFTGVEQSASEFIKTIGGGLADAFGSALTALAQFIETTKREFAALRDFTERARTGAATGLMAAPELFRRATGALADSAGQYGAQLYGTARPAPRAPGYTGVGSPRAPTATEPAGAAYAAMRDRIARELGVDPEYVRRLQQIENRAPRADGTWAVSSAGARGPLQLLPGTFNDMQKKYGFRGTIDDPEANTYAGVYYARERLIQTGGDVGRSYWGYNNGPGVYQTNRPSPAAIEGARKLAEGYTGNPLPGYVLPQPPSREQLQAQQDSRRQIDGADRLVQSRYGSLDRDRQNIQDDIARLRAAMANTDASPEQLREYAAAIAEATGKLNELLTPQEAFVRSLQDQNAPLSAVTEGERALAEVRQRMAEIERQTGTRFTEAQRREAEAAVLKQQNAEVTKLLVQMDQEVVSQAKLADAYARGGGAVAEAEAASKAYATALDLVGGTGGDTRGAMDALTEAYRKQARAAAETKIAASTAQNRDELAYLERQTQLIGASEVVRDRELALMRARQELVRADIPLESERAQAYLDSIAAMSDANSRLSRMNEAFSELQNIGTQAFDRIGSAITEAFVSGGKTAVDFKGIVKGILSEIVQYIARMAILNPVMNTLFGTNRATFSDLGGVLGNMGGGGFGGGGMASVGGIAGMAAYGAGDPNGSQGGGGMSGLFGQVRQLGQMQSTFRSITGGGGGGTGFAGIDNILNYQLISGGQTAATTGALQGLGTGVYGPATASQVTAAAGGYVPSGLSVGGALTGAATVGGGIYSAVQGFQRGGAGGIAQGVTGVAGAGMAAAGVAASAGLLGSGALAAGAAAAGPYAPLVIAAGIILSQVLGGPKMNPYATTSIDAVGGRLAVGRTDAQLIDTTETVAAAQQAVANFNRFLDAAKVDVLPSAYYEPRNPNRVFGIGEKVTGFEQAKDFEGGVPQLRFRSDDPNLNKVLEGRGFGSSQEFTTFVTNARVEIDKLKETLAALRDPLRDPENAGALRRALDALNKTYDEARIGAEKYGLSIEGLAEAQGKAQEAVIKAMLQQVDDAQEAIRIRGLVARGATPQEAELYNFDLNANQQKRQWRQQMLDLWGTAFETTDAYRARMTALEDTLGAERLAIVRKYAEEAAAVEAARAQAEAERRDRIAALGEGVTDLWARLAIAQGDPQSGELMQFEISARAQWNTLSRELIATFGESFRETEDFAARMALLERTLDAERLAIVQKYAEQAGAAEREAAEQRLAVQRRAEEEALRMQEEAARMREEAERAARDAAGNVLSGLADYARSLRVGDRNPGSPTAQYQDAVRQFQAVSGAAAAGDFRSARELSGYADTLLQASREVNGSGLAYARDFERVQAALEGVAAVPLDTLTASAAAEQTREQTTAITDELSRLRAEVTALRREMAQQTRAA